MGSSIENAAKKLVGDDSFQKLLDQAYSSGLYDLLAGLRDAVHDCTPSAVEKKYLHYALENIGSDGEIEVDDDAVVSLAQDGSGAYVQTWTFVDSADVTDAPIPALFAVVQRGFGVFGVGDSEQAAIENAACKIVDDDGVVGGLDPDEVEALLRPQNKCPHGCFMLLESNDEKFGDYLAHQGGFKFVGGLWFKQEDLDWDDTPTLPGPGA